MCFKSTFFIIIISLRYLVISFLFTFCSVTANNEKHVLPMPRGWCSARLFSLLLLGVCRGSTFVRICILCSSPILIIRGWTFIVMVFVVPKSSNNLPKNVVLSNKSSLCSSSSVIVRHICFFEQTKLRIYRSEIKKIKFQIIYMRWWLDEVKILTCFFSSRHLRCRKKQINTLIMHHNKNNTIMIVLLLQAITPLISISITKGSSKNTLNATKISSRFAKK